MLFNAYYHISCMVIYKKQVFIARFTEPFYYFFSVLIQSGTNNRNLPLLSGINVIFSGKTSSVQGQPNMLH